MRRALLLSALLLPLSLRPLSASQVEGTPGLERSTPAPTPVLPVLPVSQLAPSIVPTELPGGALPVGSIDGEAKTAPVLQPAAARSHHAQAPGNSISAQAPAAAAKPLASAQSSIEAPQAKAPIAAQGALENAAPVAREILDPSNQERPGEIDAQAAAAIFGEAKRPEGGASPVAGSETEPPIRLQAARASAGAKTEPPKPAKPKWTLTKKLIWANIVTFVLTVPAMPVSAAVFGILPQHFRHMLAVGSPVGIGYGLFTLFSYMFVHANLNHIFSNMLVFWLFGRDVENRFGRKGLWRVYLLSGLAAGAAAVFMPSPMPIIGASAAVFGVVAAWLAIARKEGMAAPDARETRILGLLALFGVLSPIATALVQLLMKGTLTIDLLQLAGIGVSWMIASRTLGRDKNPLGAKALFGFWLVVQNVLMFLLGGASVHGIYVAGHLVGGTVGALLAYKVFLKKPTSRVA